MVEAMATDAAVEDSAPEVVGAEPKEVEVVLTAMDTPGLEAAAGVASAEAAMELEATAVEATVAEEAAEGGMAFDTCCTHTPRD